VVRQIIVVEKNRPQSERAAARPADARERKALARLRNYANRDATGAEFRDRRILARYQASRVGRGVIDND